MKSIISGTQSQDTNKWRVEDGRIYFSRVIERKFFFGLTVIMLLLGILFKLGVLQ
jgi:hypothetical protein